MKKILSVILCVVIICTFAVNVSAEKYEYEGMYSVELPDGFYENGEHEFIKDEKGNFSVTIEDNTEEKRSVANISEKKLKEETEKMAGEASAAFAALGKEGEMEVVSVEKIKHNNGMTALVTVYKTSMKQDDKTVSHLQKTYEFSGIKNKYIFIYTSDKDDDINALDNAFDSIVIFENEAETYTDKIISTAALLGLIALLLFGVFKFLRGRKR